MRVPRAGARAGDHHPVPARAVRLREIQDVQVLGREPRGPDAALDDDHRADGGGGVRCSRRRVLSQRGRLLPPPRSDVEDVDVGGRPGEADSCFFLSVEVKVVVVVVGEGNEKERQEKTRSLLLVPYLIQQLQQRGKVLEMPGVLRHLSPCPRGQWRHLFFFDFG